MPTPSIPEPLKARPPKPNSRGAITVLARQAAKKAVKDRLRAQGLRLTRMKAADIEAMAQAYLAKHPELGCEGTCTPDGPDSAKDRDVRKDDAVVEEPTCRDKPLPPETPKPRGWGEKPKPNWLKRLLQKILRRWQRNR
jgi:hypothetical protein